MKFVQARNFTRVDRRFIDVLVIHAMQAAEKGETAEAVANFFKNQKPSPVTGSSAHYCIDNNSIVQCVRDHDVAWHAPGCNHNGLGLEHAGFSAQTARDWRDPYSLAMLKRSAALAAGKCRRYGIPARWLSVADLKAGRHGITSHANVSAAFKKSNHTDPGPNFPAAYYVGLVKAALLEL